MLAIFVPRVPCVIFRVYGNEIPMAGWVGFFFPLTLKGSKNFSIMQYSGSSVHNFLRGKMLPLYSGGQKLYNGFNII